MPKNFLVNVTKKELSPLQHTPVPGSLGDVFSSGRVTAVPIFTSLPSGAHTRD